MIHKNLKQAFVSLLGELSIDSGDADLSSMRDVHKLLRGSGIDLVQSRVIKGTLPVTKGVLGGIFFQTDQDALAFLSTQQGMKNVAANENAGKILSEEEILRFPKAWVLIQKPAVLNMMSPFLLKYKARFIDLLIAAFIINLFALCFPLFSSFVYDKVLGNGITQTLWALTMCMFMVMIIEFCMRIIRLSAAERFAVGSETDIDYSIFRKLLDANVNALPNIATLLEKYKQILSYRDFLSSSYLVSLVDIPFLILFLLAIAAAGGWMVAIALVCGILMMVVSALLVKPVLQYEATAKKSSENRFALLTDILTSREVIIGSDFRNDMQKRLRQFSVESAVASSQSRYWRGFNLSISNSISFLCYVSVLVAGVYMVEGHMMTSGGLLAVSMLTSRALSGASSVSGLLLRYREFQIALKELDGLLPDMAQPPRVSQGKLRGNVRFENVTCSFGKTGAPVLEKVSLTIAPGELVGLAGSPGAGKTTFLRLIAGAVYPDHGKILIDGTPLDSISHEDLSLTLGYKPQDLCLLEGSVEDAVRAGRAQISIENRENILAASGLDFSFGQGVMDWKTQIGARGGKISGGQRQLVALARAMLNDPSLLLLDEPTNGLDANLELHVARRLQKLKGKSTIIVSTHSHNILSVCDRIIVIGQSRILADGPREKILV